MFGDWAYADGATRDKLAEAGYEVFAKVPPVRPAKCAPIATASWRGDGPR